MGLFAGTQWDRPVTCEQCGKLEEGCECPPPEPASTFLLPEKQTARLSIEKRKRGKRVTIVSGLAPEETDLKELLTSLKSTCGAGGTLKDSRIEIQGDQCDSVREALKKIGYRVRG